MRWRWSVAIKGMARLVLIVTTAVAVGGVAFMLLIKLLLAVHLHALK
ncbi:hypothetical protein [Dyella sp. ASV21]|nr:hypothetical protein [Dyella sp. ASV21]